MAASAPRFASFRPRPRAPEQPPAEEPRDKHEHPPSSREETGERRRSAKPGKRRENQDQDQDRNQNQNQNQNQDALSRKTYFSDRRGDADIAAYGALNRYHVPSYRRCGFGSVLGLLHQKIDRECSTEKKIYMTPLVRQRQKRMLTDKRAARESKRTLRLVRVPDSRQLDADRDFIALSTTGRRLRDSGAESDQEEDATLEVNYRGIAETHDPDQRDDPDTYYESDVDAASANSGVTKKHSELLRATRDDPQSLQAWSSLIQHQELMMKLDRASTELSASDKQNLADIRVSLYEEALQKMGDNEASKIALWQGLLRDAQRHWDGAKLAAKWQVALEHHPHSLVLWSAYLGFVQSTFARFKYEDCRSTFSKALAALQSTDSTDASITPEDRLHILVRLTRMVQEAGYQELALAIWQAVLEFSSLAPHDLTAEKVQQFEEFWESEAPRIGEPGSKGWRHTSLVDAVPPTCPVTLEEFTSSESTIKVFQRREAEFMNKLRYPGRSTDDVGEDDPFHTIFFSDLKEYILNASIAPVELHTDAFLSFCGLPVLARPSSSQRYRRAIDPFLQHRRELGDVNREPQNIETTLGMYAQAPLANFQMTSALLIQEDFSLKTSRLSPDFIKATLQLLATNTTDNEFIGEYLLAFEARYFPAEVVKTAKRLLKDRPSSLRLYNMYGLVEAQRGNLAKADQVFGAALSIKPDNLAPADHLELFSSWIWVALHSNDYVEALWRLVSPHGQTRARPGQGAQPSSELLDEALVAFRESLESALLRRDYASAVLGTSLIALLTYLSSRCDANAALKVHGNLTAWFTSHKLSDSTHSEIHAQAIARLLTHHVTHTSIVKPALLRTTLEPLLDTFPDNTILLSAYAANEARFSVDDRIRGNMYRVLNTSPTLSVTTWAFAIHHETLKGELAGSTSHSIRALYKRATDLEASGAHCAVLWTMYLHFELEQLHKEQALRPAKRPRRDGKKDRWEGRVDEAADRVKQTFYQGLQMLPWCKEFIMLAFTDARCIFTDEELWRLYRVMMEKELRVYVELPEPGI